MKRTIKIRIAGQQYVLRSDADEEYVHSLAEFVNQRINALKGSRQVATQSDMVLAALKLADELQHERQAQLELRTHLRSRVQHMLERVEGPLSRHEGSDGGPQPQRVKRLPGKARAVGDAAAVPTKVE